MGTGEQREGASMVDREAGKQEDSVMGLSSLPLRSAAERQASLQAAAGILAGAPPHEWDEDTAAWVRTTRRSGGREG